MANYAELIAGAGLTTFGVLIARFVESRTEQRRWRRDQKARAYEGFIAAAQVMYLEMSQEAADFDKARIHEAIALMTSASGVVDVHGSEDVDRAAHKVWNYAAISLSEDRLAVMSEDEWAKVSAELRDLINTFRDLAREDLKSKAIGEPTEG